MAEEKEVFLDLTLPFAPEISAIKPISATKLKTEPENEPLLINDSTYKRKRGRGS